MHESSRRAFEEGYRWQIAHPDGDQTYRVHLRHKDGHPVPVELHNIGTPITAPYGGAGPARSVRSPRRVRLEREIQEQAAELAASRERARLAQELHDSVTSALFTMAITAGAARMLFEQKKPGVEAKLDEWAPAREALLEMRSLLFELRPGSVAEEGLVPALRKHLAAVQGRTGLVIRLEVSPDPTRLPLPTEHALYRIAQEAIHNVVRHARAHEVNVRITSPSTSVRMEISDDGVGFDPERRTDGLGLAGMAARAERLGGSVTVESAPGRATVVTAVLPAATADATG